ILDEHGRLAALDVGVPQFMLSSMGPIRFALDFFGRDELYDGDVIACNDPYHGGGHLPDWSIFAPVFAEGELVLFASIQCHDADAVRSAADYLSDLAARRCREEITRWPDGEYDADSFFGHDVKGNKDVKVHCKVTVKKDELLIDYTGSDDRGYLQAWSTRGN